MFLLIIISTVITALTVVFIIGYIFIKGVPNLSLDLFSLKYSSSNQSMLPSIINSLRLVRIFGIRDFKKMGLFAFGRCNHACNNGFAPYYKDVAGGNAWC